MPKTIHANCGKDFTVPERFYLLGPNYSSKDYLDDIAKDDIYLLLIGLTSSSAQYRYFQRIMESLSGEETVAKVTPINHTINTIRKELCDIFYSSVEYENTLPQNQRYNIERSIGSTTHGKMDAIEQLLKTFVPEYSKLIIEYEHNGKKYATMGFSFLNIVWTELSYFLQSFTTGNRRRRFYWNFFKKYALCSTDFSPTISLGDVTIGADPEFVFLRKGKDGKAQYDKPHIIARDIVSHGTGTPIGTDANASLLEIRPKASKTPEEITEKIKVLFGEVAELISEKEEDVFLETGGGFKHTIGGHIHFGNSWLKELSDDGRIDGLGEFLDDFLYYPIKSQMYGAIRTWSEIEGLGKEKVFDFDTGKSKEIFHYSDIEKQVKTIKADKSISITHYDQPSQFRTQPYGVEYRSLPSFMCDYEFTRIVFKIALGIAKKYINLAETGAKFKYNTPPSKGDYLNFITEEEYQKWQSYLNGKNRDAFLYNALDRWGLSINPIPQLLAIIGRDFKIDDEKQIKSLQRKLSKTLKELEYFSEKALKDQTCKKMVISINPSASFFDVTKDKNLLNEFIFLGKDFYYSPCKIENIRHASHYVQARWARGADAMAFVPEKFKSRIPKNTLECVIKELVILAFSGFAKNCVESVTEKLDSTLMSDHHVWTPHMKKFSYNHVEKPIRDGDRFYYPFFAQTVLRKPNWMDYLEHIPNAENSPTTNFEPSLVNALENDSGDSGEILREIIIDDDIESDGDGSFEF